MQSTFQAVAEEEDAMTAETIYQMARAGDEDALTVQQFERDFEEMIRTSQTSKQPWCHTKKLGRGSPIDAEPVVSGHRKVQEKVKAKTTSLAVAIVAKGGKKGGRRNSYRASPEPIANYVG